MEEEIVCKRWKDLAVESSRHSSCGLKDCSCGHAPQGAMENVKIEMKSNPKPKSFIVASQDACRIRLWDFTFSLFFSEVVMDDV